MKFNKREMRDVLYWLRIAKETIKNAIGDGVDVVHNKYQLELITETLDCLEKEYKEL